MGIPVRIYQISIRISKQIPIEVKISAHKYFSVKIEKSKEMDVSTRILKRIYLLNELSMDTIKAHMRASSTKVKRSASIDMGHEAVSVS